MKPGYCLPESLAQMLDTQRTAVTVADRRLPDCPIVYVNEQFSVLTGYAASECIGRNCRFLQGDDTDRTTVKELRAAIDRREDISTCLLNYRRNGEPFHNLLVMSSVSLPDRPGLIFGCQFRFSPTVQNGSIELHSSRLRELRDKLDEVSHEFDQIRHRNRMLLADLLTERVRRYLLRIGL